MKKSHYIHATDQQTLDTCVARILNDNPRFITVDTEFTRRTTYWPILELMQIGFAEHGPILIVDFKCDLDFTHLIALLKTPTLTKVFHSARQDLECIWRALGFVPAPLFDTQIAAAFCGYGATVGLNQLCETALGEAMNKKEQHSFWNKRPLRPQQLVYAANDAFFLLHLYPLIIDQLKELDRVHWPQEFFRSLEQLNDFSPEPLHSVKRFIHHARNEQEFFYFFHLAPFREVLAQEKNFNRALVIADDALISLVRILSSQKWEEDTDASLLLNAVHPLFKTAFSQEIAALFVYHASLSHLKSMGTLFRHMKKRTHTRNQEHWIKRLKHHIHEQSATLSLPSHYLAPTEMLEDFIQNPLSEHPLSSGWRHTFMNALCTRALGGLKKVKPTIPHETHPLSQAPES